MSAIDFSNRAWSNDYSGATCGCPTGAGLKEDGSCACPEGMVYYEARQQCVGLKVVENTEKLKPAPWCEQNPIYPLTGVKKQFESTGVRVGGLELTLTYNSTTRTPADQTDVPASIARLNAFGPLWESSFHHKLVINYGRKGALVARGDGKIINFEGTGNGVYTATLDHSHKLVAITGGHRFTDAATGTLETFDSLGNLVSISSPDGKSLTFSYTGGNLTAVQSNDGRTVRLSYTANRITRIVGPDGTVTTVGYDAANNLSTLTWPDLKVRTFLYENAAFPWALTGILDENNARYATYAYDAQGRALSTEHAGGVEKVVVTYGTPPRREVGEYYDEPTNTLIRTYTWIPATEISVLRPNGQAISAGATLIGGMPGLTSLSQPAGSGCAASASALAYDGSGNVLSRDDFNGARTCYAYSTDGKSREIVRVEGVPATVACSTVTPDNAVLPTGARKIKTDWHPDWELPKTVTEPKRKTTITYNGQGAACTTASARADGLPLPLVCKKEEQPLLDDGTPDVGLKNTTSYTYDGAGRLLSTVDGNGKTTTFSYFADAVFAGGSPGGPYDTYADKVVLLLHGNGADGSTTFIDDSFAHQTVTARGNAKLSTAQSKFSGSSLAFDGAGDFVVIPYSSDFAFGAGDFTIETFLYKNANNPNNYSRIWNPDGDFMDGVSMTIDASGNFGTWISTNGSSWTYSLPAVANLANGQWYHLALVRSGGAVYAFVNGTRYTVTTAIGTAALFTYSASPRVIGGQSGIDRSINGFFDEFRITKGVARYTENFSVPTQEFNTGPGFDAVGHSTGDLQSSTNAAGHATQYNLYDPAGRVRRITDSKRVVTDITYAPRGWVSTVTVTPEVGAARTTVYGYDNTGQLTRVDLPDGTNLSYVYDAAHRLTSVTDGRGNSVTYTLDNAGNRTAEQVRDPSGTLQRSISRSFDALNRVQQVTGAPM